MKTLFTNICASSLVLTLTACTSIPTRENNPDEFNLINSGQVKEENILQFKDCLIERYEVRGRLAYPVKTQHHVRTDGHRVEGYAGEYLMLSTDIFNSGKTNLIRAKNSALIDLKQQIKAFELCLSIYK